MLALTTSLLNVFPTKISSIIFCGLIKVNVDRLFCNKRAYLRQHRRLGLPFLFLHSAFFSNEETYLASRQFYVGPTKVIRDPRWRLTMQLTGGD